MDAKTRKFLRVKIDGERKATVKLALNALKLAREALLRNRDYGRAAEYAGNALVSIGEAKALEDLPYFLEQRSEQT